MIIKPKVGDVIEPDGAIIANGGKLVQSGVVIIHRSRLRRARRLGWLLAPEHILPPISAELVGVCRA